MLDCVCVQAWRTYYHYHSDYVCAEGKLKEAEKQEEKQKQSAAKKLERLIEKVNNCTSWWYYVHVSVCIMVLPCSEYYLYLLKFICPQRQSKVQDIYLKCSKARNEYLLNLAAANTTMKKYYLQDISALTDVSAFVHICAY